MKMSNQHRYALCVKNRGYAAALEVRKLYRVIGDHVAAKRGLVRVVDESGEDYLYPAGFFLNVELSPAAIRVLSKKSA
jgi:IS4 transposase